MVLSTAADLTGSKLDLTFAYFVKELGAFVRIEGALYRAPRTNAVCERFVESLRCECVDRRIITREGQLYRVIKEYLEYLARHGRIRELISRSRTIWELPE